MVVGALKIASEGAESMSVKYDEVRFEIELPESCRRTMSDSLYLTDELFCEGWIFTVTKAGHIIANNGIIYHHGDLYICEISPPDWMTGTEFVIRFNEGRVKWIMSQNDYADMCRGVVNEISAEMTQAEVMSNGHV